LKHVAVTSAGDLADAGDPVCYKGVLTEACDCNECRWSCRRWWSCVLQRCVDWSVWL